MQTERSDMHFVSLKLDKFMFFKTGWKHRHNAWDTGIHHAKKQDVPLGGFWYINSEVIFSPSPKCFKRANIGQMWHMATFLKGRHYLGASDIQQDKFERNLTNSYQMKAKILNF